MKWQRIWSRVLVAVMLLTLLPTTTWATEQQTEDGHTPVPISVEDNAKFNQLLADRLALMLTYGDTAALFSTGSNMAGVKLEGNTKVIYDTVAAKISDIAKNGGSTIFNIPVVDESSFPDAFAAYYALWYDYPYEFYWRGTEGYHYDYTNNVFMLFVSRDYNLSGKSSHNVDLDNYESYHDYCYVDPTKARIVSDRITSASGQVQAILNEAKNKTTDFERLAFFKDKICELVDYNYRALEDEDNPYHEGDPWQLIWVFDGDPLTDVVCEGYARAFQYLCDLMWPNGEVQCYSPAGTMNGGGHMWNIVTLEGANYLVDVTGCDSALMKENPDNWKFMVGCNSGSVNEGYSIYVPRTVRRRDPYGVSLGLEGTYQYVYTNGTTTVLPADVLTLAEEDYAGDPYIRYSPEPITLAVGDEVNLIATLKNADGSYTFSLMPDYNKPLPAGLQLDPVTGNITGTVTTACTERTRVLIQATKEGFDPIYTYLFFPKITDHDHIANDTWSMDDTSHWYACTICDAEIDKTAHTTTTLITKNASCTEDGEQTVSCSVCGWNKTEGIPASHSWGAVVETTPATYTSPGIAAKACNVCGEMEIEEIPQLQHIFGGWEKDAESHWQVCICTDTEHEHMQIITAKTSHGWNDGETIKEPSTAEAGEKIFICTVCGQAKTETIPKLDTPAHNGSGGYVPSGPNTPSNLPVTTTGQNSSTVTTTTTAAPSTSTSGGKATATVDRATGNEIVRQAVTNNSENVVIAPKITGNVTKTEVSIPATTVGQIGSQTDATLTVSTPVADVTIPNNALGNLSSAGGQVTVITERTDKGVELSVKAGGKTVESVPGGVALTVPVANTTPGTVAVLVNADGTREVVRKSVVDNGIVTIPLNGSAKLEIVDNSKPFSDVPPDNWTASAVAFVSAHELFNGTGSGKFSPDLPMSRGMLAVVLHNLESNPDQPVTDRFADVNNENWYAEGIAWAAANGIVSGYGNGQFGPNDSITREQLAVMLWRYAGSPAATSKELNFDDADKASNYAIDALRWAVENGIINGYGNGQLGPQGLATRAQVAQMLKNYMER